MMSIDTKNTLPAPPTAHPRPLAEDQGHRSGEQADRRSRDMNDENRESDGHGSVLFDQMGSRFRRRRTATAKHAAAKISPSQRPGVVRNRPRRSCEILVTLPLTPSAKATVIAPLNRQATRVVTHEVPNTILSSADTTTNGNTAQRNVARRAHAET